MTQPTVISPVFAAYNHQRLVRLCAYFSGDSQAVDDLAQETLLEAWRNAHKLHDPCGQDAWLAAIARRVCWRWGRRLGRELAHIHWLDADDSETDWPADSVDLEIDNGFDLRVVQSVRHCDSLIP